MPLSGELRGADTREELDQLLNQFDKARDTPAGELSARLGLEEERARKLCWIHPEPSAENFCAIADVDTADVDLEWIQAYINAEYRRREIQLYPERKTEYR